MFYSGVYLQKFWEIMVKSLKFNFCSINFTTYIRSSHHSEQPLKSTNFLFRFGVDFPFNSKQRKYQTEYLYGNLWWSDKNSELLYLLHRWCWKLLSVNCKYLRVIGLIKDSVKEKIAHYPVYNGIGIESIYICLQLLKLKLDGI